MSANDVLELEDRNPLPGDTGDIYLAPGNMTRAEDAGAQMQPPVVEEDNQEDTREARLTRAAASRIVNYEFRKQRDGQQDYMLQPEFINYIVDWMKTSKEVADKYASLTANINMLVDEAGVPESGSMAAKVDLLTELVMSN